VQNEGGKILTEQEFLEVYNPEIYSKPSVTTDIVTLKMEKKEKVNIKVLLVKRRNHPAKDLWALPGGFVSLEESTEECARKKLKEKTGLGDIYMEQLYTFSNPMRDPRMRIISISYLAMMSDNEFDPVPDAKWFDLELITESGTKKKMKLTNAELEIGIEYTITEEYEKNGIVGMKKMCINKSNESNESLAFDHAEIIYTAIERIKGKCMYTPILFNLMPDTFTIPQLQEVFEWFLGKKPHNTLFRKQMENMITKVQGKSRKSKRPAQLYKYGK